MKKVAVAGANHTRFGRLERGLLELMSEAARPLLESLKPEALVMGVWSPDRAGGLPNPCAALAGRLELEGQPAWAVEAASATGAAALHSGWRAVASGQYRRVLVVAAEKLTHLPYPEAAKLLASVLTPQERAANQTMVSMAARVTAQALSWDRFTVEALQAVAIKNHNHGALNPKAHFQRAITNEEYLKARIVCDPLRLYDCAPISDGAAAVMLERAESSHGEGVVVAGVGQGTETWALEGRQDPLAFMATARASRQAYNHAGWGPRQVEVVEMHDAFTSFELLGLEACGLYPAGRAGPATLAGETGLEGRLPVNPSGGLKARGHPIGASGLAQVCELVWQLTGAAGQRQVAGRPKHGLAHSIGGLAANNLVTLLERA